MATNKPCDEIVLLIVSKFEADLSKVNYKLNSLQTLSVQHLFGAVHIYLTVILFKCRKKRQDKTNEIKL